MKPTDAGKRVLKRQKPMVYGQQNTHIGMKTHRVIIEEQRKVTVKNNLLLMTNTLHFLPFLFIAYKYFVKTDFFHNFAPVFAHLRQYTGNGNISAYLPSGRPTRHARHESRQMML